MKRIVWTVIALLTMAVVGADAAPAGRRLLRRLLPGSGRNVLRRDLLRDRTLPVHRLEKPRTVFRYTTRQQARRELREGLRPRTHMTARGGPGRPPSPEAAQRRYGLPRKPEVRETIRLPEGTPVRSGKALGGRPGYGELTNARPLPPEAIRRVVPLKPHGDKP